MSALSTACASGKRWVHSDPDVTSTENDESIRLVSDQNGDYDPALVRRRIGSEDEDWANASHAPDEKGERPLIALEGSRENDSGPLDGELLGVFRNTYYDFPSESEFSGKSVPLMNASCEPIKEVPSDFFDALCVQGSGTLTVGSTVSFAKRDCSCARTCPRTGQKICFDELDRGDFPFGRGAQGTAITPLRTIAVDSSEIPLGTWVYIPEYDGVPRREGGVVHDGCFKAEDRGMKVQGKHVDIFTGNSKVTSHLNQQVPSNRGVHVYVATARCAALL